MEIGAWLRGRAGQHLPLGYAADHWDDTFYRYQLGRQAMRALSEGRNAFIFHLVVLERHKVCDPCMSCPILPLSECGRGHMQSRVRVVMLPAMARKLHPQGLWRNWHVTHVSESICEHSLHTAAPARRLHHQGILPEPPSCKRAMLCLPC